MKRAEKIVALVPMRHHSQRVPGKNYRELAGKPLFHHILHTLQDVSEIDQIVVDTDSSKIMEGVAQFFPGVTVLERPEHLRADDIPMNEVLLYDTSQVEGDLYLQTHSTNPLLTVATISKAINQLLAAYPTFDSLFGVTRRHVRLWDELTRPINHNPAILLQTQDLPPVFEDNSCMYIFQRENLVRRRNRLSERPMMFEISAQEAMDIDNEIDFRIVDLMMRFRMEGKG
ncbi:MAG: acylneuraminate cytidylyltransferase family protein [Anaerolineaceae bacterium]|nr:acylneuraminate cytidylyltransferase family protein [Anaerolineaceae bacterium]